MVTGMDTMGWKRTATCTQVSKAYHPGKDIGFFKNKPDVWLPVSAGMYAIFFPEDAHMPMISTERIRKVVMKIALDQ